MNKHRIDRSVRVGEPSSKYGYDPEAFDRDMAASAARSEKAKETKQVIIDILEKNGYQPREAIAILREIVGDWMVAGHDLTE